MTSSGSKIEKIMERFAVEYRADASKLEKFCVDYPDLAIDLVSLAHELALQKYADDGAPLSAQDEAWILAACAEQEAPAKNPFASIPPKRFASIRTSLSLPGVVINSFRDRLVELSTVPVDFIDDLARELSTNAAVLARYLDGPPKTALGVSYKSDTAPKTPVDKMSFDQILEDAGVSPGRRLEILGRD